MPPADAKPLSPSDPPSARAYHHGHLRQALVEAAIVLLEESGPDGVSMREAAKRAGVSPGAPFRHFASRAALMTAVAEVAMRRLREAIDEALAAVSPDVPAAGLRVVLATYLDWALRNPGHFQVISGRGQIDIEGSLALRADDEHLRVTLQNLLYRAARRGLLIADDPNAAVLAAQAFVYGLARMAADGQFEPWGVSGDATAGLVQSLLAQYVSGLLREGGGRKRSVLELG